MEAVLERKELHNREQADKLARLPLEHLLRIWVSNDTLHTWH